VRLEDQEGALAGGNAYEGHEFMTSTDERFRPVNLFNGPDGALYVVDMYRGIIQHRIYVTSFLRKQIEDRKLDEGIHYGRIWRIVPDSAPKANFQLGLAQAASAELVRALDNPNGWVRDTAQRLLVERRDPAAKAALTQAATDAQRPALARVHALWTLEGAGQLERATVIAALRDADPRVVAAAVRVSEPMLRTDAELAARVASLVETRAEPSLRLQLALSLGEAKGAGAEQALRALVVKAGPQPYLADAVVSGLAGREVPFVTALIKTPAASGQAENVIKFATATVLKSGKADRIESVLALAAAAETAEWARTALLAGVRQFLPRMSDGRTLVAALPVEPKPLVALAARKESPSAATAQQLLEQLRWPGKPGAAAASRPLSPAEQALFEKGKTQYAAL
jgi:hypothetical protein